MLCKKDCENELDLWYALGGKCILGKRGFVNDNLKLLKEDMHLLNPSLSDRKIVKERIEDGANEKAAYAFR